MYKYIAFFIALFFLTCSCQNGTSSKKDIQSPEKSSAEKEKDTDREEPEPVAPFKTVMIADQIWSAENLNLHQSGSWCYENAEFNCSQFGRIYRWKSALEVSKKFPGWRLPTVDDWKKLMNYYGESQVHNQLVNGPFKAKLGGFARYYDVSFDGVNESVAFWTSTARGSTQSDYGVFVIFGTYPDGRSVVRINGTDTEYLLGYIRLIKE